ncbi:Protein of unknown function (DUF2031), putative [Plasmodium chabaudi adami]|uniref:Fam-b protein n=1 Tax=Plasmodium chabaudi adami TaxID=5826 RepID=A0A1C6WM89_PLACE|nr:Protein of unknown function (DUF2031), putative [Plasmodium chabaudi adami]
MRVSILNFVFFIIIICSFEYAKNELYYVNEKSIYLERNVIHFRNNRALADADNQFDLYDFYQSTLSLANQFSDCDGDDEEITNLRNIIDSHLKKHKENNALPNLNKVDKKTRRLIHELQKELEGVKKELDNIRNDKLEIQPIQDKRIIKRDENMFVSEHENFRKLENEHNWIDSSSKNELKNNPEMKKDIKKFFKKALLLSGFFLVLLISPALSFLILLIPNLFDVAKNMWKFVKFKLES